MTGPASPSGNRHDGVRLKAGVLQWKFLRLDLTDDGATHVAHPVDIDAARTAVIEAGRALKAVNDDLFERQDDDDLDGHYAQAWSRFNAALYRLDALTTKGATT